MTTLKFGREMTRKELFAAIEALKALPKWIRAGHYADDPTNHLWVCDKCHDACSFFATHEKAETDAKAHVVLFH